jgi:glycosyltransferase involved in cell wall biosynthesis
MPKTVAIYLQDLGMGGIQRSFVRLAQALRERGHQVTLLIGHNQGPLGELISDFEQLVLADALAPRKSLRHLIRYMRQHRPDAILAGDESASATLALAKKLSFTPTRVVVCTQTSLTRKYGAVVEPRIRLRGKLLRFFYPLADRLVAVSEGTCDDVAAFTGVSRERVKLAYNPVIGPELRSRATEEWANRPFADSPDPVAIAVGRLTRQKDYFTLLDALRLVNDQRPANLVIYGEGEDRAGLEARIAELGLSDRVRLPGNILNPYPAMREADLYVMSSQWEGLPTVLVEALYLGTPIVSTDCEYGPMEILENGKWGRLVPQENPARLAEAMLAALEEGRLPRPKVAWERFTTEAVAETYERHLFGTDSAATPQRGAASMSAERMVKE